MVNPLPRKTLLAYCDPWCVRPGEAVNLHVSSNAPYQLSVARLAGNAAARGAPQSISHPAAGRYPGVARALPAGSYAETVETPAWPLERGFRIELIARPSTPAWDRPQALAAQMQGQSGFWLGLAEDGLLVFRVGDGRTEIRLASARALRAQSWVRIAAAWQDGAATLSVAALDLMNGQAETLSAKAAFAAASIPLRFGAAHDPTGAALAHYNGRISGPRLCDSAGAVLSAWDFSHGFADAVVAAAGVQPAPLRLINAPARAIPGPAWDSTVHNPALGAAHYDAVHFHDDDLEDAAWPADHMLAIPNDLKSGVYAVTLETETERTIVPFFVRPAANQKRAPVTFLASTATYLAYANNRTATFSTLFELAAITPSGMVDARLATAAQTPSLGPSVYDHHRDGSPCMIVSRRRPLLNVSTDGFPWSFTADLDVIAWLEQSGLAYDVVTDEDLNREGADALGDTRCVVTGSHPEYVSTRELDGLNAFLSNGGRLMYLGGNGFYWRVSHPPDRPWLMECRRAESGARYTECEAGAYHHQFGGELGGLWRRIGRTPQSWLGVGMAGYGFDDGAPYMFNEAAHDPRAAFIVDGVTLEAPFGAHGAFGRGGGAAGSEIDRADFNLGTPAHALVLASSGPHSAQYFVVPEETLMVHIAVTGDLNPNIRADLVFFETPGGGAVFSTGSIAWAASFATNHYENDVARLSSNVLRRFIDATPFEMPA